MRLAVNNLECQLWAVHEYLPPRFVDLGRAAVTHAPGVDANDIVVR